jgi:hypothetical protein
MSVYRCCFLHHDGRLGDVAILECADDAEATAATLRLSDCRPKFSVIELWQRDRMVFARSSARSAGEVAA